MATSPRMRARYAIRSPDEVHRRRWWTLAVLCAALTVIGVDNTILNVAVPSIVRELGARGSQLSWVIDAYTIVFACLLLTAGAIGDRFGRKPTLTLGLVVFAGCSLLAAGASSPELLIVARGLMGIGGALIFPTTLSILTNTFTGHERARAIGIWAGVTGIGVAIGPLAGGILLEHYWWGSVFFVNVPICIATLIAVHYVVPNSRNPERHPLDLLGAALSIVGLVGLLFGIIAAPDHGWGSPTVLTAFSVAFVFLALFVGWELHTEHPMLQLRFFRNPRFSAASATITLAYFALFGSTFLLTQYFQFVLGYSPLESGFMTAAVAIGVMIVAPQAPKLVVHWGTKRVVVLGLAVVAAGLALYSSDTVMSSTVGGWLARLFYGAGLGLTTAPATESIMGSLPPGNAGVGSAVNDTTRQTGGALGVAVLGTIVATRFHQHFVGAASHLPAKVAAAAKDSVGKAMGVADALPTALGNQVRAIATQAFIDSTRVAYLAGSAVVLVALLVAWKWLPARPQNDEEIDAELAAQAEPGSTPPLDEQLQTPLRPARRYSST